MFTKTFFSLTAKKITKKEEDLKQKELLEILGSKPVYYNKETASSFNESKAQFIKLITYVIDKTKDKYPIFSQYKSKISSASPTGSEVDKETILNTAKKTLEDNFLFVLKHPIDPSLLQSYSVEKCSPGAASNLRMALLHFSGTEYERVLCNSKELLLRALAQDFTQHFISPYLGNEVHYVNACFNYLAPLYGCEVQNDLFAPSQLSDGRLKALTMHVQKKFTLAAFLETLHLTLPALPREEFDASNAKLYKTIQEYGEFIHPGKSELTDELYKLYESDEQSSKKGKVLAFSMKMKPKKDFEIYLNAVLAMELQASNLVVLPTFSKGAHYFFNGTQLFTIEKDGSKRSYQLAHTISEDLQEIFYDLLIKSDDNTPPELPIKTLVAYLNNTQLFALYSATTNAKQSELHECCLSHIIREKLNDNKLHSDFCNLLFVNKHPPYSNELRLFAKDGLSYRNHLTKEQLNALLTYLMALGGSSVLPCLYEACIKNVANAVDVIIDGYYDNCEQLNEPIGNDKNTLVMLAVRNNAIDALKVLVKKGADINQRNVHGLAPLIIAIQHGDKQIIKYLLDSKVDLQTPYSADEQAFHHLLKGKPEASKKRLLKWMQKQDPQRKLSIQPYELAGIFGHDDLKTLLQPPPSVLNPNLLFAPSSNKPELAKDTVAISGAKC
ncbi:MAG: ankyrin repeat domain-containing protein [Legionella sp.]|nr:ankyrin repeat domain-containing protein [Legionella sp.]